MMLGFFPQPGLLETLFNIGAWLIKVVLWALQVVEYKRGRTLCLMKMFLRQPQEQSLYTQYDLGISFSSRCVCELFSCQLRRKLRVIKYRVVTQSTKD